MAKVLNILEKSAKLRTLQADDTYKSVIKEITDQQVAMFVNVDSTEEQRGEAHDVIRALRLIEDYFDSVYTDEAMHNRKRKK
jgi:hypothetical protein|tara:strand:+ start:397 stop:642 length:246 start_codon:yes stop_codon:yes gene_type:complete